MKAYVLGLKDNWRGSAVVERIAALGFEPEIVWGIDGRAEFTNKPLHALYDDTACQVLLGRSLAVGELACVLGHARMYQQFLASGAGWALFVEDDTELLDGVTAVVDDLELLGPGPHVVTLRLQESGHNIRWPQRTRGALARLIEPPFGTSCYFMNRSAALVAVTEYEQRRADYVPDWPYRWAHLVKFWMSNSDLAPHSYAASLIREHRDQLSAAAAVRGRPMRLRRTRKCVRLLRLGYPLSTVLRAELLEQVLVRVMALSARLGVADLRLPLTSST